jgi:hypothetical protein
VEKQRVADMNKLKANKKRRKLTRRYFLKYKIETRLRRRGKWRKVRMRAKVRREQNRELQSMIPIGTSYVFCGRLNFLGFHLSKLVMMYFSFLALASYHNRIRVWCENIGAALVSASEGYTTKKCPRCNRMVNVGALSNLTVRAVVC